MVVKCNHYIHFAIVDLHVGTSKIGAMRKVRIVKRKSRNEMSANGVGKYLILCRYIDHNIKLVHFKHLDTSPAHEEGQSQTM